MAIVATLSAVLFSGLTKTRSAARSANCVSNLRQLGTALLQVTVDNDNKLPTDGAGEQGDLKKWKRALVDGGYFPENFSDGAWRCPEVKNKDIEDGGQSSYAILGNWIFCATDEKNARGGYDSLRLSQIPRPSKTWLVGDGGKRRADGTYVAFGQIKPLKNGKFANQQPAFRHPEKKVNVCFVDGHVGTISEDNFLKPENNFLMSDVDGDGLGD